MMGAPLICGATLAAKFRGKDEVGITFAGDGASNQGTFLSRKPESRGGMESAGDFS